ncbi:hypothetical protein E2C01_000540 [Portunus trituberculatus]|uniref:Uncharacterized protein n=1 Tax=Portunus trituberculatus TaxID=210409 RepID=A0A5B7CED1_PORTR|nr:hypothetical protein [Portunus trituberculatus]
MTELHLLSSPPPKHTPPSFSSLTLPSSLFSQAIPALSLSSPSPRTPLPCSPPHPFPCAHENQPPSTPRSTGGQLHIGISCPNAAAVGRRASIICFAAVLRCVSADLKINGSCGGQSELRVDKASANTADNICAANVMRLPGSGTRPTLAWGIIGMHRTDLKSTGDDSSDAPVNKPGLPPLRGDPEERLKAGVHEAARATGGGRMAITSGGERQP